MMHRKKCLSLIILFLFFALFLSGCRPKVTKEYEKYKQKRKEVSQLFKSKEEEGLDIGKARELVYYAIQAATKEKDYDKGVRYFNEALKFLNKFTSKSPEEHFMAFKKHHFGGKGLPNDIESVGLKWIISYPGPVIWGDIEKKRGHYEWEDLDHYIKVCQISNTYPLLIIWPYAKWDQAENSAYKVFSRFEELGNYRTKPHDITAYQIFIRKLVERYDGDGIDDLPRLKFPIKYWQVLSNPSTSGHPYSLFEGSKEDYLEVLRNTYSAIKSADKTAKVLHADELSNPEYLFDLYSMEAKKYFNIANVSMHNYNELKMFLKQFKKHKIKRFWVTDIIIPKRKWERTRTIELFKVSIEALSYGAERIILSLEDPIIKKSSIRKSYFYKCIDTILNKIDQFITIKKINYGQFKLTTQDKNIYILWGWRKIPKEIKILGNVLHTRLLQREKPFNSFFIQSSFTPVIIEVEK